MKETVSQFTARTGLRYDPPKFVTDQARALGPDDAVPTLFRFPGACGLLEQFRGAMERLAPARELWAADSTVNSEAPGAVHFGTFAILQPLRFAFAAERPGIYVGENRPVDPEHLVWIPPSRVRAAIPWDGIATAEEAAPHLGNVERERADVIAALDSYLDELTAVAKAGLPDPQIRWCDRPEESRRQMLADAGIAPRWTGRHSARP